MREVEQDAGKRRFILDHQHGTLARLDGRHAVAVILEGGQRHGLGGGRGLGRGGRDFCGRLRRGGGRRRRFHGALRHDGRQHQCKRTALAWRAGQLDATAQQGGQVARNRQPQPRAAVAAAGGAVGLVEGVENLVLLVVGNADARILHLEAHPAVRAAAHVQAHGTRIRKLDGVRQQVFQDLLEALAVADERRRRVRRHLDVKNEFLLLRLGAEQHLHAAEQFVERHGFRRQFQLACLDLGNVEDIVDEGE
ncbi:hypothetical protein D3C85_504880 [compost metagenome]